MRKIYQRNKAILGLACGAALVVNVGVAWACWHLAGFAAASATTGSAVELVASGAADPKVPLYPGAKAKLRLTIRNDNSFAVALTQLKRGKGPVVVDAAHASAGCIDSGVSLTDALYSLSISVGRRSTTTLILADAIKMTNQSDSACQGANFSIPVVVVGKSLS